MACDGPRFAMHNCRPRSLGVHTMAHGSLLPGKPLAMDVEVSHKVILKNGAKGNTDILGDQKFNLVLEFLN